MRELPENQSARNLSKGNYGAPEIAIWCLWALSSLNASGISRKQHHDHASKENAFWTSPKTLNFLNGPIFVNKDWATNQKMNIISASDP